MLYNLELVPAGEGYRQHQVRQLQQVRDVQSTTACMYNSTNELLHMTHKVSSTSTV